MNRPKLIALDVDGTLIDHNQVLAERTIAAISAVRRRGIVVAIATGRPIPVIGPAVEHADWLVGANGATVARAGTLELLVDRVVPMDDVRALMAMIRAAIPGVAAAVLTETESVFETGFEKFLPPSVERGRHVVDVLSARGAGARSWSVFHHTITAHEIAERVHAIVSPKADVVVPSNVDLGVAVTLEAMLA
jgi:hydroxymethylpyrimidine pyrophosphatase-like HAD family hydrolase